MSHPLYLPSDEFRDTDVSNLDLAADYLELNAILSKDGQSFSEYIVDALEDTAESNFTDVDEEIRVREEIASEAVARMSSRKLVLRESYPFDIDDGGNVIFFTGEQPDLGQTAYIVSLILSNLRSVSPLLVAHEMHPTEDEVRCLRQYFQYLATAAIAAEVGGPAWSFGFPRPDRTGFRTKLSQIWATLGDGSVHTNPSSPRNPKDDQIDIFGWREQNDGLPGFLLVAAQVATGNNWKEKSIKSHVARAFPMRWFNPIPVTEMVAYHVIPFARPDDQFRDDVLVLGNVLHRLRVPSRVREAVSVAPNGPKVEAFDLLPAAAEWVRCYVKRARMS